MGNSEVITTITVECRYRDKSGLHHLHRIRREFGGESRDSLLVEPEWAFLEELLGRGKSVDVGVKALGLAIAKGLSERDV